MEGKKQDAEPAKVPCPRCFSKDAIIKPGFTRARPRGQSFWATARNIVECPKCGKFEVSVADVLGLYGF